MLPPVVVSGDLTIPGSKPSGTQGTSPGWNATAPRQEEKQPISPAQPMHDAKRRAALLDTFTAVDFDGSGAISRAEFLPAFKVLSSDLAQGELLKLDTLP